MVPGSSGMVRGLVVCSDNGDVLPEAAIPADRAKDIPGRTGPIGYLDDSVTRRPGKDVCQES